MKIDHFDSETAAIRNEIDRLRRQIIDSLDDLKKLTRERRSEAAAQTEHHPSEAPASDSASVDDAAAADPRRATEHAREAARRLLDEITDDTQQHPLMGLLVAFGLGFLAARLFTTGGRK